MPKIDVRSVPEIVGCPYPAPFDAACAGRVRQRWATPAG